MSDLNQLKRIQKETCREVLRDFFEEMTRICPKESTGPCTGKIVAHNVLEVTVPLSRDAINHCVGSGHNTLLAKFSGTPAQLTFESAGTSTFILVDKRIDVDKQL